jgi:hypothetical protein
MDLFSAIDAARQPIIANTPAIQQKVADVKSAQVSTPTPEARVFPQAPPIPSPAAAHAKIDRVELSAAAIVKESIDTPVETFNIETPVAAAPVAESANSYFHSDTSDTLSSLFGISI